MKHLLLISYFAAVFALPARSSVPQASTSANSAPPAAARVEHGDKLRVAGVPNFGKIDDHLYRGAQPHASGLPELKKLGISTIVDLRGEDPSKSKWEQKQAESLG